jgi:hypothetical protein
VAVHAEAGKLETRLGTLVDAARARDQRREAALVDHWRAASARKGDLVNASFHVLPLVKKNE